MCTICSLTIEFDVDHPETLSVAVATRQAIDAGLLTCDAELDMARSRHQAILLLGALQQRLEAVLSPSALLALPDFFVLMIESRTWGYFTPTLRGFATSATPSSPRVEPDENGDRDCIVLLSQAAAATIAEGGLPFTEATDLGVAVVDAPSAPAARIRAAFAGAYPVGCFSKFVCTEVA